MASRTTAHIRPRLAFVVVGTVIFLTLLDLFVVNIALTAISEEFPDASPGDLSWVLILYAIVFAATLVPAGRFGDLYGRRRLFLIGLLVFIVGSLVAAASPSLGMLLAARAVQAVGAGLATPNSLGVLLPLFPAERRPVVIALWGVVAGLGAASGPPLGGVLAEIDWRWIFLLNLPLGVVALLWAPRLVPEFRDDQDKSSPDMVGAGLLAASVAALTLGLSQGPGWDWDGRVVATFVLALVLVALVVRRSRSHPSPVVEPELFRRPTFSPAMAATLTFWGAFAAMLLASSLYLAMAERWSVIEAGLGMTPGPAISAVAAAVGGRLAGRVAPGRVAVAGSVTFAVGAGMLLVSLGDQASYVHDFLPGQLLIGIGAGFVIPSLMAITLAGVSPTRFSTAVGVYSVFRQLGVAVGTAAWVAVIGDASLLAPDNYVAGWISVLILAVLAIGFIVTAMAREPGPADRAAAPSAPSTAEPRG